MTTQIALIAIEGVLAKGADLRSSPAQRWARPLYEGIRSQYRTVGFSAGPTLTAKSWLHHENMGGWSAVLGNDTILSYPDWKIEQVRDFLANAWEVAFLVDCDTQVSARAQEMGVMTLSVGMPVNWVGWKPDDVGFRPWNELPDTVESSP
jgi:hypothetical protein